MVNFDLKKAKQIEDLKEERNSLKSELVNFNLVMLENKSSQE